MVPSELTAWQPMQAPPAMYSGVAPVPGWMRARCASPVPVFPFAPLMAQ